MWPSVVYEYVCPWCGAEFEDPTDLEMHMFECDEQVEYDRDPIGEGQ